MRNINNNLNGIENETDRRARESAKHKQELYDYARSVEMIGGEENKTEQGYDDADSITGRNANDDADCITAPKQ